MTDHGAEEIAHQAVEAGDFTAALPLLKALAERNSTYAVLTLGWMSETGALGPADMVAARSFYDHAAAIGSAEAYASLGWLSMYEGDATQAEAAFAKGAALGDDKCLSAVDQLATYRQETIASEAIDAGDLQQARRLLEPLAKQQSIYALLTLGWLYETGQPDDPDLIVARSYYERAARLGSVQGHRRLGSMMKDAGHKEEARAAFDQGAKAGDLPSMFWLGTMMDEGLGGPVDVEQARYWLEAAAALGHHFAKRKLAGIELCQTRSIFRKWRIWLQIAGLAKDFAKDYWRNPNDDRLW